MLVVSQVFSSLLQILSVFAVSYIVYRLLGKPQNSFRSWIGLEKTTIRWKASLLIGLVYLLLSTGPVVWLYSSHRVTTTNLMTVSYQATGFSFETLLVILIWSVFQTSLSEEILFRACFRKTFSTFWGEKVGNLIQAFLFAAIHILALTSYGAIPVILIFVMTFSIAYALGEFVSKNPDGSLLESWLIHATVNLVSQIVILYFWV